MLCWAGRSAGSERWPRWCADYAFGQRKFGGNAQAITKARWLHHTSLLWDFDDARMRLLKHPSRTPEYRAVRPPARQAPRAAAHAPTMHTCTRCTASLSCISLAHEHCAPDALAAALVKRATEPHTLHL